MLRKCVSAILIVAMVTGQTMAAGDILLITGGRYFLIEIEGASPTISEIETVINSDGENPVPNPPASSVRARVTELTKATGDPLIAQGIAEGAYGTVRQRVADGSVTWDQGLSLLSAATSLAVGQSESKAKWEPWREAIATIINEMKIKGELTTKDQQVAFLLDVEEGMKAAFPNSAIDLAKLLELIRMIIDLIVSLQNRMGPATGDGAYVVPPLDWIAGRSRYNQHDGGSFVV